MAKFEKKADATTTATTSTETAKSPIREGGRQGFVDAARYTRAADGLQPAIDQLDTLRKSLLAGAADVAAIEEARRQEGATYDFNLKLKRDVQLAEFAKEDAKREADFEKRDQALTAAEVSFGKLVDVSPTSGDHLATSAALHEAFNTKLEQEYKEGEKAGKESAAAAYAINKKVDEANAAKETALLKQENEQLKAANAKLESQYKALLDAQAKVNETVAEVAKTGLQAAGGVVNQGNAALGTAAGAIPGGSRVR